MTAGNSVKTAITIGTRDIGEGHPPYIIAEVGSNWSTFEDAKNSIALAKACGADAVKFQAYTPEALYGVAGEVKGVLPLDWLPRLAEKARACSIDFLCSAFSPELMEAVDPHVAAHKIASAELTHVRMLEKARALGKPVLLSTGASGEADIRMALQVLGPTPVVLLYCVAAYPARGVNLKTIPLMKDMFHVPVGFSDHSADWGGTPVHAVKRTFACVIEKHVNFVGAEGPDAPHSLSTDEFRLMVKRIRDEEPLEIGPTAEERPMVLRHNRRLIATRAITPGDTLAEGQNFGIYRSLKDDTHALSPWAIDHVVGKRATRAIQAGDGVGPGDYE